MRCVMYQVRCCSISGDGRTIVSGSDDKTVRVWDATTGQLRHTLEGHTDTVRLDGRDGVSCDVM